MIASLPMYARPSNKAAHDALWALIRDNLRQSGIAAPDDLDHYIGFLDGWAHPDLVIGQICNLPYRAQFRNRVTIIGAADYALPDCAPGYYHSVFVVRKNAPEKSVVDFADARFAANDLLSNSGYGMPQQWAEAHGFLFHAPLITGSHLGSIAAVAEDRADIAAIDAQTWWIASREHEGAATLRVIGHTHTSPGMSFITRADQDPRPYFSAISGAIDALPTEHRHLLNLRGIVALPPSAYDIPLPPPPRGVPV